MAKGKQKNGFMWTEDTKLKVVTTYLATGSLRLAAAMVNVPIDTVNRWHRLDWWKEYEQELRTSENMEMSAKLKKIVDKSLDTIVDRLDEGDPMYDPRTGQVIRVPLKARDAIKAMESAVDKRQILNNQPTKIVEQRTIEDRLTRLSLEFEKFARAKEIVYAEEGQKLPSRIRELSGNSTAEEEQGEA